MIDLVYRGSCSYFVVDKVDAPVEVVDAPATAEAVAPATEAPAAAPAVEEAPAVAPAAPVEPIVTIPSREMVAIPAAAPMPETKVIDVEVG